MPVEASSSAFREAMASFPSGATIVTTSDADGLPFLKDVSISLRCATYSKVDGGDHLVLIGRVEEVGLGEEMPFVYFRRKFHALPVADDKAAAPPARPQPPVVIELDLGWM